ncbi:MAG: shikimate kinase [Flavobacterium sp.]|jgi:shikimate kinase|nr:shikimate kinase [Flavobacterium sp.]
MKKIILLGYMGSGKSTIAKLLANLTSISYLDLDEIIEKQENSSVKKLFSDKGEIYFRKLEHQILAALIQNQDSFILSLGGGTPCYSNNHEFLKADHVISIYLNASVDTLYERLLFNSEQRPLIANKNPEEMKEFIAKNLFDRSYYYNQAKYKITVEGKSPEEILSEIENLLA